MVAYLAYAIIYNHIFEELQVRKDVNISEELMPLWYPMLWKHKAPILIYNIHDAFLGCCKALLTRAILVDLLKGLNIS